MTELRRWDVELKCRGYYGFGGGYSKIRGFTYEGDQVYCGLCPMAKECWDEHKIRTAEIVPGLAMEFERRAGEKQGPALMQEWWDEFHIADPYTMITAGNLEDGMCVGMGEEPKDRGPYTLTWPLEPRSKP